MLVETDIIAQFRFTWYASPFSKCGLMVPCQYSFAPLPVMPLIEQADSEGTGRISAYPYLLDLQACPTLFKTAQKVKPQRADFIFVHAGILRIGLILDHLVNDSAIRCGTR